MKVDLYGKELNQVGWGHDQGGGDEWNCQPAVPSVAKINEKNKIEMKNENGK